MADEQQTPPQDATEQKSDPPLPDAEAVQQPPFNTDLDLGDNLENRMDKEMTIDAVEQAANAIMELDNAQVPNPQPENDPYVPIPNDNPWHQSAADTSNSGNSLMANESEKAEEPRVDELAQTNGSSNAIYSTDVHINNPLLDSSRNVAALEASLEDRSAASDSFTREKVLENHERREHVVTMGSGGYADNAPGIKTSDLDRQIGLLKSCECIKESEVRELCNNARDILLDESNIQSISSPITVSTISN